MTTCGENGPECFAVGLDYSLVVRCSKNNQHVEGHRDDSATIIDLALTTPEVRYGIDPQQFH